MLWDCGRGCEGDAVDGMYRYKYSISSGSGRRLSIRLFLWYVVQAVIMSTKHSTAQHSTRGNVTLQ